MTEAVLELLQEQIERNGFVRLRVGGYCMSPVIRNGAELTVRRTTPEDIRDGDIIAYTLGEKLLVHRLVGTKNGRMVLCGDRKTPPEHEVSYGNLMGRVEGWRNPGIFARAARRLKRCVTNRE